MVWLHASSVNITLDIVCILISAVLLLCLYLGKDKGDRLSRVFGLILLCNIGVLICDFFGWYLDGLPGEAVRVVLLVSLAGVYILASLAEGLFTQYIISHIALKAPVSRYFIRIAYVLVALGVILAILTQFTGLLYTVDSSNCYHRSPYFWLAFLLGAIILALDCVILLKYRKSLTRRDKWSLYSYIVLPAIGILAQMMLDGIMFIYAGATFSYFLIYVNVQVERDRLLKDRELELNASRVDIMLSQIQPHFLYNALSAIRHLCEADPQEAKVAIAEFSQFLRMNMDSLTRKTLIPFSGELNHVKNYLALEKRRFGERLEIVYRIETQDFLLPALSLQPIVENAVRYGVSKREEGGLVTIETEETPDAWRITVSDNGVGFDLTLPHPSGRTHIGIRNVSDRLQAMCGGSLSIHSVPDKGTVAIILIPREEGL